MNIFWLALAIVVFLSGGVLGPLYDRYEHLFTGPAFGFYYFPFLIWLGLSGLLFWLAFSP